MQQDGDDWHGVRGGHLEPCHPKTESVGYQPGKETMMVCISLCDFDRCNC